MLKCYGAGCVGSAVGGTSVGTSVGMSVGGTAVNVGTRVFVGKGKGVLVNTRVGVLVGMAVLVGTTVLPAAMSEVVLAPLTEGFVPQSFCAFIQIVTSFCNTAGSQALKKS